LLNLPGINVPRSRFLPVKKTSDLLLVMSNLYELSQGTMRMSQRREFKTTPLVKLGDAHFSKVSQLNYSRFDVTTSRLFPKKPRFHYTLA